MTFTVNVAGVNRTSSVEIGQDVTFEDVRTPRATSVTLTFRPARGFKPVYGQTVALIVDGRTLWSGIVTGVANRAKGLTYCYDVTCTSLWVSLRGKIWQRYRSVSASSVFAALMALAPAGFSVAYVEPSMPTVTDLIFTGETLEDAIQKTAGAAGAIAYLDENGGLHAYITADSGVETPDTVSLSNILDTPTRQEDWSQVVTRVFVEGKSSALVAPVFGGDTAIAVADASLFGSSGLVRPTVGGIAPLTFSGTAHNLVSSPSQTEPTITPAGPIRIGVYTTSGLPPQGWVIQGSQYIRYTSISPWDVALILPGAVFIAATSYAAGTVTVTTSIPYSGGAHGFNSPATAFLVSFYGTGEVLFDGQTFTCWTIDSTHFAFNIGGTPSNVTNRGYCGRVGLQPITTLTWSGDVASAFMTYGHPFAIGDWITVTGASVSAYNGTWQITSVSGGTVYWDLKGYQPTSGGSPTIHYAGTPQATIAASSVLRAAEMLTGVSGAPAIAGGSSAAIVVQRDDTTAQVAIAAATGVSGIKPGYLSDSSLELSQLQVRGDAELKVRSMPEIRLGFTSLDPKLRAGMTVAASLLGPATREAILADSPVAYWPMGERLASTLAGLGSDAHALTIGGTPVWNTDGPCYDGEAAIGFSGSQWAGIGYRFLGDSTLDGALSIEAWLYATGTGIVAVSQGNTGAAATKFQLFVGATGYTFRLTNDAGTIYDFAESGKNRGDSTWHHVFFTRAAVFGGFHECKLYVDGALTTAYTVTKSGTFTLNDFAIGRRAGASAGSNWAGAIAHVALYSAEIASTRVSAHYAARLAPPTFTGSHKVTSVTYSGIRNGPAATLRRAVVTNNKRFQPVDVYRQMLAT